jgi:putative transposase
VIVAYIDCFRSRFGVEPICAVLTEHGVTIAPSTYYAKRAQPVSPAALEEAYLVNALITLHDANWGVYGPGSCGWRPAVPAWTWAGIRWLG